LLSFDSSREKSQLVTDRQTDRQTDGRTDDSIDVGVYPRGVPFAWTKKTGNFRARYGLY